MVQAYAARPKQLVRYLDLLGATGQGSMMCLQFLKLWMLGYAWTCLDMLAGVRIEKPIVTDFVNVLMVLSLPGALACCQSCQGWCLCLCYPSRVADANRHLTTNMCLRCSQLV